MDIGSQALSDYIFASKYARHLEAENRRETYDEAVTRVMSMHREKYGPGLMPIAHLVDQAEAGLRNKRVLGSQRNMQYGGVPVLRKNERSYNCTASYCDRARFFAEAFYLLLCGCGVGFSVQRHHVENLPSIHEPLEERFTHVVADTIEGWADALGALVSSYFDGSRRVSFDYSLVRPEGSPLSSGAGFAPGPKPLRDALEAIRTLLDECVAAGQTSLRPIDAYDIVMHASCAVLSGGVRRSATICIFSADDEEMMLAKAPGNFDTVGVNPQRARSNNSAVLLRSSTTFEAFQKFVDIARVGGGEPGFYFVDSLDVVPNPCLEVGFYPVWEGRSCWHFCNLSTINGAVCKDPEAFYDECRNAATLGTLQAGYTSFPYLGPDTEALVRHEALIGVSIAGVQDSPNVLLTPEVLEEGVRRVKATNDAVAAAIGIRPAARLTAEKPDGTSAPFVGAASGKHVRHARRYIRRVQANPNELPAQAFAATNPDAVEASVWKEDDLVLAFPIEAPEGAKVRADETALEQLRDVVTLKKHWIDPGRITDRCNHPAVENNVSNTVTVRDDEWDDVAQFIYDHRECFVGVSLLGAGDDLKYPQAPYVSVDEDERLEERILWRRLRFGMRQVDYSKSVGQANRTGDAACGARGCEV